MVMLYTNTVDLYCNLVIFLCRDVIYNFQFCMLHMSNYSREQIF